MIVIANFLKNSSHTTFLKWGIQQVFNKVLCIGLKRVHESSFFTCITFQGIRSLLHKPFTFQGPRYHPFCNHFQNPLPSFFSPSLAVFCFHNCLWVGGRWKSQNELHTACIVCVVFRYPGVLNFLQYGSLDRKGLLLGIHAGTVAPTKATAPVQMEKSRGRTSDLLTTWVAAKEELLLLGIGTKHVEQA